MESIYEAVKYSLPALIIAIVAYFFFRRLFIADENRRRFYLKRESMKTVTPVRIQAYERFTLLLERIDIENLLSRVKPQSASSPEYLRLLLAHIDQEFDHNVSQQIYISKGLWESIKAARSQTKAMITEACTQEDAKTAFEVQKAALIFSLKEQTPASRALDELREEFKLLL